MLFNELNGGLQSKVIEYVKEKNSFYAQYLEEGINKSIDTLYVKQASIKLEQLCCE